MSQDCFLNSKDGKNCGTSRGLSGLVRLSECNDEVKHHLISCHLSKELLSENELILTRTGLFHLALEDKRKMSKLFGVIIPVGSGSLQQHFLLSIFSS